MHYIEAISTLLRAIGTDPVNDPLTSDHPDVAGARAALDLSMEDVQIPGMWFNTEYNLTFAPEASTGRINVQSYVDLSISNQNLVKRGKYLYNRSTRSFKFECSVMVHRAVAEWEWDDCPRMAQRVAYLQAAVQFVRNETGDSEVVNDLAEQLEVAMIKLQANHIRSMGLNKFHNPRIAHARRGVRPSGSIQDHFHGYPGA